jgi:hypothetical protein
MKQVLLDMGFTDAAISAELESPETSMAKVFIDLLSAKFDIESLRWELANSGPPNPPISKTINLPEFLDKAFSKYDLRRDDEPLQPGSPESFSLAVQPCWMMPDFEPPEVSNLLKLETFEKSTWIVMGKVQNFLGEGQFLWFHPNPTVIYVKGIEGTLFFSVVCGFKHDGYVTLTLSLLKGQDEEFIPIAEEITHRLVG